MWENKYPSRPVYFLQALWASTAEALPHTTTRMASLGCQTLATPSQEETTFLILRRQILLTVWGTSPRTGIRTVTSYLQRQTTSIWSAWVSCILTFSIQASASKWRRSWQLTLLSKRIHLLFHKSTRPTCPLPATLFMFVWRALPQLTSLSSLPSSWGRLIPTICIRFWLKGTTCTTNIMPILGVLRRS